MKEENRESQKAGMVALCMSILADCLFRDHLLSSIRPMPCRSPKCRSEQLVRIRNRFIITKTSFQTLSYIERIMGKFMT